MSGGSWDYLYIKINDAALSLKESKCFHRRAFADLMFRVSGAMKAIEWVDSGDCSPPHDINHIKKALAPSNKDYDIALVSYLDEVIRDLQRMKDFFNQ